MNEIERAGGPAGSVRLAADGIRFDGFTENDPRTVALARQWVEVHGEADLPSWASTALGLGAQVAALGEASGGIAGLAGTVAQLAERAEAASAALATDVSKASSQAAEVVSSVARKASEETARAVTRAREQAAADLAAAAKATAESVQAELRRLFGSDDAPAARAVSELVRKQMAESDARLGRVLGDALDRAGTAWDADNPASAVAGLERRLTDGLARLQDSVSAVAASAQAQAAVTALAAASPAKGRTFEERAGGALEAVATAIGGCYTGTGDTVGLLRNCKKGDGVLEVPSSDGQGTVRLVVEATTTGAARRWGTYLDEAMRNRGAATALGLVPSSDLVPGGAPIASVGPGRMVMALDTEGGGTSLLHAACTLLLLHAQRDAAREHAGSDRDVVDARLREAEQQLATLADTLKAATGVRAGAAKVVAGIEACQEALARSLGQARAALRGLAGPVLETPEQAA